MNQVMISKTKDYLVVKIPLEAAEKGGQIEVSPVKKFKEFTPTAAERRDLKKARLEFKRGDYLTLDELKRKLGLTN